MLASQKPYLINAIYEWCEDNGFTPHLAIIVDSTTIVPMQYVENNQLVLNIASTATKDLVIDKEWITLKATFGGIIRDMAIPVANVIAIFAKENGHGMQFDVEHHSQTQAEENHNGGLRLVK
jgi:stringent starvation protein B